MSLGAAVAAAAAASGTLNYCGQSSVCVCVCAQLPMQVDQSGNILSRKWWWCFSFSCSFWL